MVGPVDNIASTNQLSQKKNVTHDTGHMTHDKGSLPKKTTESVRKLIPRGWGGSASQCSHFLRYFFHAPILLVWL